MPRRGTKSDPQPTQLVPRVIGLLPCLSCRRSERALEEVAQTYLAAMHGEPPPRPDHQRAFRFLPRSCCKQTPRVVDPGALVA